MRKDLHWKLIGCCILAYLLALAVRLPIGQLPAFAVIVVIGAVTGVVLYAAFGSWEEDP